MELPRDPDEATPWFPSAQAALEARLAVRPNLHPALVNRLTMAAIELHAARNIITGFGRIEGKPSKKAPDLAVNPH